MSDVREIGVRFDKSSFLLGFVCGSSLMAFAIGAAALWSLNQ